MTNSVKGDTPLKLSDGREFVLILDMEALLSIEERTDKPLQEVMARAQQGYMSAVASIAQAAFATHHPNVTRAEVLEILRTDAPALEAALGKATANAFPKDAEGKGKKAGKPQATKNSGRNGAKRG